MYRQITVLVDMNAFDVAELNVKPRKISALVCSYLWWPTQLFFALFRVSHGILHIDFLIKLSSTSCSSTAPSSVLPGRQSFLYNKPLDR